MYAKQTQRANRQENMRKNKLFWEKCWVISRNASVRTYYRYVKVFYETLNDELNIENPLEPLLFSIWKKYKLKVEGCQVTQNRSIGVEAISINSDNDDGILNINFDVNTNNQIELSRNETDCILESQQIQKRLDQTDMDSLQPLTPDSLYTLSLTDYTAVKTGNKTTAPDHGKDHLHWPQLKQNDEIQTWRKKKKVPFAVTSIKWQKFVEAERAQKKIQRR